MSEFSYYFKEPCEFIATVCSSDSMTELGRYSFRGYPKGMDHFFQIISLLAHEAVSSQRRHETPFENFASVLRSSFYWKVKNGHVNNLEEALRQHISELRQNKFIIRRILPFLPDSSATWAHRKKYELTPDRIFKRIHKMRQERIIFYERILEEYKARKSEYILRLQECLDNKQTSPFESLNSFNINSILSELEVQSINSYRDVFLGENFWVSSYAWYLNDLITLDDPDTERYTKGYKELPRFRAGELHADLEGMKVFFELFSVFKDEMSFIILDDPDESIFEKVSAVLIRDFLGKFEQNEDLQSELIKYIEDLEKFEFLSLPKAQFYDQLSRMIYGLRARRIKFYELLLKEYLANKEEYNLSCVKVH